jgi:putative transposase
MMIKRAYKVELDPNEFQRGEMVRHAGCARFTYNWGLQRKKDTHANGEPIPSAVDLHRELNQLKKMELDWMYEVSKCAPQEALRDLDKAFKNFYEKRAKFPRFKSRRNGIGSFRLTGHIKVFDNRIQLPRLGTLRLKESNYIPTNDIYILSATVSERAGHWFVSVNVEEEIVVLENDGPVVGVDVGVSSLATVSDGTVIENPKSLKVHERKLKKLQKDVSRKKKGSNNRQKAKKRLAICHYKVANIRKDAIHKATTMLARTKSVIGIETLSVKNMVKNHNLAGAISDAGLAEFHRQLEYKAKWYGSRVVKADRFYPSTKKCSRCGNVKEKMGLGERTYECDACGFVADRDLNAALNLKNVAVSSTETLNACQSGEVHDGRRDYQVLRDEAGMVNGPK